MRFMVIVKGSGDCASGPADEKFMAKMRAYNESLEKAGVMIGVERLHPVSKGARVWLSGAKPTVIDGPFPETKELVGGFWFWEVGSLDEAIEWVKRCPYQSDHSGEIEIRQVLEPDGFGPALTRDAGDHGHHQRAQSGGRK
jgi:hypothetical protein